MTDNAPTIASFPALPIFCARRTKPVLAGVGRKKPALRDHEQRRRAKAMGKHVPIKLWETHSWTKQIVRTQPRAVIAAKAACYGREPSNFCNKGCALARQIKNTE